MAVVCCTALLFVHDMMILCPSKTYTVTDKTKDPHLPVKYGFTRGFVTIDHSGNFYSLINPFYVLPLLRTHNIWGECIQNLHLMLKI